MQNLPNDVLRLVALELDDTSLVELCKGSKRIKKGVCDSEIFWQQKHRIWGNIDKWDRSTWKESYKVHKFWEKAYSKSWDPMPLAMIMGEGASQNFILYLIQNYGLKNPVDTLAGALRMGYKNVVYKILEEYSNLSHRFGVGLRVGDTERNIINVYYLSAPDDILMPFLSIPIEQRDVEMVKYMLEKGADPFKGSPNIGWMGTPFAVALDKLQPQGDKDMVQIIKLLLQYGDKEKFNIINQTRLFIPAELWNKLQNYPELLEIYQAY